MKRLLITFILGCGLTFNGYGYSRHEHYPPSYYYDNGYNKGYNEGKSVGAEKGMIATGLIIIGLVVVYEAMTNLKVQDSTRVVYRF